MQCVFTSFIFASSSLFFLHVVTDFGHDCITCKSGNSYLRKDARERPQTQFTCVTCNLSVKTSKYTCFYAASTSRRIHAIARNKTCKLRVTSSAGCRLTYLHFADEFTRGVIADCLQLQVILCVIANIFACDCGDVFACD